MIVLSIWETRELDNETYSVDYANYWRNLITDISDEYVDFHYLDNKYELINNELQKYNARLDRLDNCVEEIIFDNEASKNWFLLRYL